VYEVHNVFFFLQCRNRLKIKHANNIGETVIVLIANKVPMISKMRSSNRPLLLLRVILSTNEEFQKKNGTPRIVRAQASAKGVVLGVQPPPPFLFTAS